MSWQILICAWDLRGDVFFSTDHLSYYFVTALVDEKLLVTDYQLFVGNSYTSLSLFREFFHKFIQACVSVQDAG